MEGAAVHNHRRLAAGLAGLLLVALTGCTAGNKPASVDLAKDSTLKKVLSRGELRVADCLTFAPFGFLSASGEQQGYDVDLAKEMAKRLGVKVSIIDTTSANRIPNLTTDKVDIVFCNFTSNTERAKQIAFTDPYIVAGETLLVRKDSPIVTLADTTGKTVATVKGSTNSDIVKKEAPQAKLAEYDSSAAAILAVKQGQADAMIEDSNFLAYQAKLDPSLRVNNKSISALEYNCFGVRQGDPVWLAWVNLFLREINTDGTNLAMYEKWFGAKPEFPLKPVY
jgi:polar amino acid transport system substrate-binding protein